MTRRRAPAPLPALRALASIPLAGVLVACSPAREEPPPPAALSAAVPATVPGLIAAGEILVNAAQPALAPAGPVAAHGVDAGRKEPIADGRAGAAMPATRRCRARRASPEAQREPGSGGAATDCADTRP